MLDGRLRAGEIDKQEHREAVKALEERYHRMCQRLDGSYRLPERD